MILSASIVFFSSCAGNAAKKDAAPAVADAIAAMPAATAGELESAMAELAAAAPASVELLASMLQPAENGCNSKIEYALAGLSRYASANKKFKSAVAKGFKNAAEAQPDIYNKAFLEAELRLLGEAPAPEKPAPARRLKAGEVIAAMTSESRSERVMALSAAPSTNGFYRKLTASEMAPGAEADILYFLGERKAENQLDWIISKIGGPYSDDAEAAAAKIGGAKAAAALSAAASPALLFFDGDFGAALEKAFDEGNAEVKAALMDIASARHMTFMSARAFDGGYYAALKGLVTKDDCGRLADLLDTVDSLNVKPVCAAFIKAASETGDMYAAVAESFASAAAPVRFYGALAATGRDEAVETLAAAYREGSPEALAAISSMNCPEAADVLLEAAAADENLLYRFVEITRSTASDGDQVLAKYLKALEISRTDGPKGAVLAAMGQLELPAVAEIAVSYLDNKELARTAAYAAKNVIAKCSGEMDHETLQDYVSKLTPVFLSSGYTDDVYAVDELNRIVEKHEQ